jgi:hypothetical protein
VCRVQVATLKSGISQYDNADTGSYEDDYDDDRAVNKGGALNGSYGRIVTSGMLMEKESEGGVLT